MQYFLNLHVYCINDKDKKHIDRMRKFAKFLLMAALTIPFLQSCNTTYEQADQAALVTVQKSLDPAGFYGILDNGERLYPGVMRVSYTPSNDLQRAIIYFSELEEPREGFAYNADVFNVAEVATQHITRVRTPEADTLTNGLRITNAWIGGGFLNVEFQVNVDQYLTKSLTVALQDMMIDGPTEPNGDYYPLELGFKCYPDLENGVGTTISTMACFWLGDEYNLNELGRKGFEIRYQGIDSFSDEPSQVKIVTPETNQQ